MPSTSTLLTSLRRRRRRSSSPTMRREAVASPHFVALRTAAPNESRVHPRRITSASTIASRLLTVGQNGEEEVHIASQRQHEDLGGDEDDRRHSLRLPRSVGTTTPTTRSCVEFGLAWVPDGPFMYMTASQWCCGPGAAVAAKEAAAAAAAAAASTRIPAPLPVRATATSTTTSSDAAAPQCGPPSLEIVHECDDASYRSSEAVSAAVSGSGVGEHRTNNDDDRHHRLRTSLHSVLVLLMHPTSNRYEILSVLSHEHCEFVGHSWKDYVDAALRGATFTSVDEAFGTVGVRYTTCLRLLAFGVVASPEPNASTLPSSTSIRIRPVQLPSKESSHRRPWPNEVLVPVPHGTSASWTHKRARAILQQASEVVASALSRLQGDAVSVQGMDSVRVHDPPIAVLLHDGNDKVCGTEQKICRADPSSPLASRIGRTPLVARRQALVNHERQQFCYGRIRHDADPNDKENDS